MVLRPAEAMDQLLQAAKPPALSEPFPLCKTRGASGKTRQVETPSLPSET